MQLKSNNHKNVLTEENQQSGQVIDRRRLIRHAGAAAVGAATFSALPERWTKPLVDSMLLPVHAQTSPITTERCDPEPTFVLRRSVGSIVLTPGAAVPVTQQAFSFTLLRTDANGNASPASAYKLEDDYFFQVTGADAASFSVSGKLSKGMAVGDSANGVVSVAPGFECPAGSLTLQASITARNATGDVPIVCTDLEPEISVSIRCQDGGQGCIDEAPDLTTDVTIDPPRFEFEAEGVAKTFFMKNNSNFNLTNVTMSIQSDPFSGNYQITRPVSSNVNAGSSNSFDIVFQALGECPPNKPDSVVLVEGEYEWICPGEAVAQRAAFRKTFIVAAQCFQIRG